VSKIRVLLMSTSIYTRQAITREDLIVITEQPPSITSSVEERNSLQSKLSFSKGDNEQGISPDDDGFLYSPRSGGGGGGSSSPSQGSAGGGRTSSPQSEGTQYTPYKPSRTPNPGDQERLPFRYQVEDAESPRPGELDPPRGDNLRN
jgi:hypothetical protein